MHHMIEKNYFKLEGHGRLSHHSYYKDWWKECSAHHSFLWSITATLIHCINLFNSQR